MKSLTRLTYATRKAPSYLPIIFAVMAVISIAADYVVPGSGIYVMAMQISTLVTGAAVTTVIPGQANCDMFLTIGDCDTTMPLTGYAVEIDGTPTINIQGSTPLVSTFFKLMSQMAGSGIIALVAKNSLGKIAKSTTYRLTNGGVTTPAIFAVSNDLPPREAVAGGAIYAATKGVNALSSDTFSKFSFLAITNPTNITTVDITYKNGNRSSYAAVDLDSVFSLSHQTEANGRLDSVVSCIDNREGDIDQVVVNTGATGVTVMVVKINNEDFKSIQAAA